VKKEIRFLPLVGNELPEPQTPIPLIRTGRRKILTSDPVIDILVGMIG